MLLVLAIVNFVFLDDFESGGIVSLMVVLSVCLSFVQERRSNNAAEKLRAMVSTTASVLRPTGTPPTPPPRQQRTRAVTGDVRKFRSTDIVPGDVVWLSAGDMIPADVRLLTARDLFINQARADRRVDAGGKISDADAPPPE